MKIRNIILTASTLALVGVAGSLPAALFDNTTGGPITATVNAGGSGDYLTLGAAVAGFNGVVGGINREWTIEIQTNTTETANMFMSNTFGVGGSVTIKPAPATTPVVDFTDTTSPAGIFGHFVIGVNSGALPVLLPTQNAFPSVNGYILDGSNTVGGTTRDLTFQAGTVGTPVASSVNRLIRLFGDNDGVVIKNMNISFFDTGGNNAAIGLGAGQVPAASGNNVAPDNCTITNCSITSGGTGTSGCVGIDTTNAANGTLAAGNSIQGLTVTNNNIIARQRGVFMNSCTGATVRNNTISLLGGTSGAVTLGGVFFFNSNGVTPFTIDVDRNVIDVDVNVATWTAGQGVIPLFFDSGSAGAIGTFNISNNVVKSVTTGGAAVPADILMRGLVASSITSIYNIEHNSINIGTTLANGTSAGRAAGIAFPLTFTTGSANVQNNLIRYAEADGTAVSVYTAAATNVTIAGNDLVDFGTVGRVGATTYADLVDWQGAGYDSVVSGGQSVDPTLTTPAWDANMHFASKPIAGLGTVAASTVLTDIDGDARPATGAVPGADEPAITAVADWTMISE